MSDHQKYGKTNDTDYQQYLTFGIALAYEAGDVMRRWFGAKPESSWKLDDTIVTVADKEVNRLVIERINEEYPEHGVDGEEESAKTDHNHVWVCDPIDGTNLFARNVPMSVFSL